MKTNIREKLIAYFNPPVLNIIDESHFHIHHNEGGKRQGTHFKVEIVSDIFQGMKQIDRHKLVYHVLDEELKMGVHALSMNLKTPEESKTSKLLLE